MRDKICVITGGSNGIGKATATELARRGAQVIIICKSHQRGEQARKEIYNTTGNANVDLIFADLAIQLEVRRAALEIMQKYNHIDVLINNAAVMLPKREVTRDGIEKMFAINYLSHFLLTNLLLDHLRASTSARIISVASLIPGAKIDLDDLMMQNIRYSSFAALRPNKLALNMFSRELAKRLSKSNITVNTLHPGIARSGIMDKSSWVMKRFMHLLSTTPEKAAETSIYLACSPEVEGVTGKFFTKCQETPMKGDQINDQNLWAQLWAQSAKLTQLA